MGSGAGSFSFLDVDTVLAAQRLFDEGARLLAGKPVLERRWRHARMSMDRATYVRYRDLLRQWQGQGKDPADFPLDRQAVAARVRQTWTEQIAMRIRPGRQQAERARMEAELTHYTSLPAVVPPPAKFRDLPRNRVFDFTADLTRNWKEIVQVVKDPEAESGIANRLSFPNRGGKKHALEKYKLPMPWGLYAPKTKTFVTRSVIKPEDVPGPGYHWYSMGRHEIGPSYYLYFFWSWIIQLDLESVVDPENPHRQFEVWARIKFTGPAFPHGKPDQPNAIFVERVVLIAQ
jgi:hypothetical protein